MADLRELMLNGQETSVEGLVYKVGLDKYREAVVSSHFMHRFGKDQSLHVYGEQQFCERALRLPAAAVTDVLIPVLSEACRSFCAERAAEAKRRARESFRDYGLATPNAVGTAQFIAEAMFDRQYSRESSKNYSKYLLCTEIAKKVAAGEPIRMVIPALPFKISSPLKSRGRLPDLAEVNFLLQLYEIALTIELLYREARPGDDRRLAEFTVVSDGSRFSALAGEPHNVVETYRLHLLHWVERLGIGGYVTIYDYHDLLKERLPPAARDRKFRIAESAALEYAAAMWPVFDPNEVDRSLRLAADVEPDPERANPEGRFVSLLKSLVYTINYKALKRFEKLGPTEYRKLYREITAHLFEPYHPLGAEQLRQAEQAAGRAEGPAVSDDVKEYLRQLMLREVWDATILYMAEIKSDRDLSEEPILTCLPDHFRWTIHAKRGQLAIAVPTASGLTVQAWAGTAVFKHTKRGIKLCTLPVLALEGAGAIPVRIDDPGDLLGLADQPFFYIYPDVEFDGLADFLTKLAPSIVRRRAG
jgi:pyoverdine/dityrosine biosynthesis protein Dit1